MNEQDKYLIERLDRESGHQLISEAVTPKDQAKFSKIAHMSDPVTTYKCDTCGREEDKKADAEGNFPDAYNCLGAKCTGGRMDALKSPGQKQSTPIAKDPRPTKLTQLPPLVKEAEDREYDDLHAEFKKHSPEDGLTIIRGIEARRDAVKSRSNPDFIAGEKKFQKAKSAYQSAHGVEYQKALVARNAGRPIKEALPPPAAQSNTVAIAKQQGQKLAAPVAPKPVPAPDLSPSLAKKPIK